MRYPDFIHTQKLHDNSTQAECILEVGLYLFPESGISKLSSQVNKFLEMTAF